MCKNVYINSKFLIESEARIVGIAASGNDPQVASYNTLSYIIIMTNVCKQLDENKQLC